MPNGMDNSLTESRYTNLFSARRGCGTFKIMISAERLTWPSPATGWAEAAVKRDLPVDVQFSLLGPLRAWRGPAEVDLGPNQQRAVLALLLVRANQFVKQMRLDRAREQLVDGQFAVARVSKEVGYGSVSHFISEFRARFGVTPRAYGDAHALSRRLRAQRDDKAAAPTS